MSKFPLTLAFAIPLALSLSGCISFGGKTPERLLSLTPEATLAAGTVTRAGDAKGLTVVEPDLPRSLDNNRVAVKVTDTSVAYVKDAQWADSPKRLFQGLLTETLAARTGRLVMDEGRYTGDPGERLAGDLVEFGVDARKGAAVVTFDALLVSDTEQGITRRRFTASAPVSPIDSRSVGPAINRAANDVAAQVAEWIKG